MASGLGAGGFCAGRVGPAPRGGTGRRPGPRARGLGPGFCWEGARGVIARHRRDPGWWGQRGPSVVGRAAWLGGRCGWRLSAERPPPSPEVYRSVVRVRPLACAAELRLETSADAGRGHREPVPSQPPRTHWACDDSRKLRTAVRFGGLCIGSNDLCEAHSLWRPGSCKRPRLESCKRQRLGSCKRSDSEVANASDSEIANAGKMWRISIANIAMNGAHRSRFETAGESASLV